MVSDLAVFTTENSLALSCSMTFPGPEQHAHIWYERPGGGSVQMWAFGEGGVQAQILEGRCDELLHAESSEWRNNWLMGT